MELIDKLKSIADAIRAKTGKSDNLTLDQMAEEITQFRVGVDGNIDPTEIPLYVKEEAARVIADVNAVRKNDSIVFIALSDTHHYGRQGTSGDPSIQSDNTGEHTNVGNLHAAMAAKILTYALKVDFVAHLGDVAWGHSTTPSWLLNSQIDDMMELLDEVGAGLPHFYAIGNHDTGFYNYENGGELETGANLYEKFTSKAASEYTVFGDTAYGGYCYRDFDDKKLRVFLLNSSESHISSNKDAGITDAQLQWFEAALQNLNEKPDSSEWMFIVLCHYPADYGANSKLASVLFDYTIDAGKYDHYAKYVAQFHGHVHNFLCDRIHYGAFTSTSNPSPFPAIRIGVPNAQYARENYYGTFNGVNFHQDVSYPKTIGTGKDTSFVVNVINPSDNVVHSICYGAGYNRSTTFTGYEYYSITRDYENANTDRSDSSVVATTQYSETITPVAGYALKSISITMGGEDASRYVSKVNDSYKIDIGLVVGNLVIVVKTTAAYPKFTNRVKYAHPLGAEVSKGFDMSGVGYYSGVRLGTDNYLKEDYDSRIMFTTGYIPIKDDSITTYKDVRIAGTGIVFNESNYNTCRLALYDDNYNLLTDTPYNYTKLIEEATEALRSENGVIVSFHAQWGDFTLLLDAAFMVISAIGDGSNLIVTVNEPIAYGEPPETEDAYTVSYVLNNVASTNYSETVYRGSTYTTILSAPVGYRMESVNITVGGIPTNHYYNSSDGTVTIPDVSGDIVISATAKTTDTPYTNVLLSAGYESGLYISNGVVKPPDNFQSYTTGYIQLPTIEGRFQGCTLYFKNLKFFADDNYHRVSFYGPDKKPIQNGYATFSPANPKPDHIVFESVGNNVVKVIAKDSNYTAPADYVRICCFEFTEDSVITINEPID